MKLLARGNDWSEYFLSGVLSLGKWFPVTSYWVIPSMLGICLYIAMSLLLGLGLLMGPSLLGMSPLDAWGFVDNGSFWSKQDLLSMGQSQEADLGRGHDLLVLLKLTSSWAAPVALPIGRWGSRQARVTRSTGWPSLEHDKNTRMFSP